MDVVSGWVDGWWVNDRMIGGRMMDGWVGWMMGGRMHASVGGEMIKIIIDSVPIVGKAPSHPLLIMLITVL